MVKYNRQITKILSLTLCLSLFPNLVLAKTTTLDTLIEQKIQNMSLDEKIGQLFIVGFPQAKMTTELESFIASYKPGSYILFKRNIHSAVQVQELNQAIYKMSYKHTRLPPLIAIDQEGGAVSRLPITPAPPNAFALGQTQSPLLAEEMGFQTGRFLREVGFNMNLAPVLDVADPLTESFIGVRSFGADPKLVGDLGVAYSRGLLRARVIPTAKHFPGTGSLEADPHDKVAANSASENSLRANDLKPYELYSGLGGNAAIMLSHYIYPALDESREPASFSRKIVTTILRDELKYQGIVVTDDLQMQGSRQLFRPEAAALKALLAGADIVMLTYNIVDQKQSFNHLKKAVLSGEFPKDELQAKLRRILKVKAFANLYRRDPRTPSLVRGQQLSSKDYSDVESSILEQNLKTSLVSQNTKRPSRKTASDERICLLSPSKAFIESFTKSSGKTVISKQLPVNFAVKETKSWIKQERCVVSLVAVTGHKTAGFVKSLSPEEKLNTVVINLSSPYHFKETAGYRRVLQLYFNHHNSGSKVGSHLDEILDLTNSSYVIK